MNKDQIVKTLAGLGVTATVVIGGVVANLDDPKSFDEKIAPTTIEKCTGEEVELSGTKICITKDNYEVMKGNLKFQYDLNKQVNPSYFRTYVDVVNNEIDKKDKKSYTEVTSKEHLMDELNKLLNNQ